MAEVQGPGASLLPDVLCPVFSVTQPGSEAPTCRPFHSSSPPVLSFAEHSVNKHWRKLLRSCPAAYDSLALGSLGEDGERAQLQRAAQQARAVAARAPVVRRIELRLWSFSSAELDAALSAVLDALLARPGSRVLMVRLHGNAAMRRLLALLPAAAHHPSLFRLDLLCSGEEGEHGSAVLEASEQLHSLPHLRHLRILPSTDLGATVYVGLPMPRLETLKLELPVGELGPTPPRLMLPFGTELDNAAAPLFSSLSRLDMGGKLVPLDGRWAPALQELRLCLVFPGVLLAAANLDAMSRLSRLELSAIANLELWLSLSLEEPVDEDVAAALRSLGQLTRLGLRLGGGNRWLFEGASEEGGSTSDGGEGEREEEEEGEEEQTVEEEEEEEDEGEEEAAPAPVRLDCRLLAGMDKLQSLAVFRFGGPLSGALESLQGLRQLTALHTLSLDDTSPLRSLLLVGTTTGVQD
ncbi:hypothetical protein ABPG75_010100 [Micractinium tetrahymenae]